MEIHPHMHSVPPAVGRKKWTHYLWEFLMLFLAVFCGFMAEYLLEHKIEKTREKQYINSFVEDLEADTATLSNRIVYCELTIKRADSLIAILGHPDREKMAREVYYFLRWIHRSDVFSVNDRTIVQLRNAGGMRLVSSKSVSDSMISYYKEVELIRFIYEEQTEFRRSLRPLFPKILDGMDYGKFIDEKNNVIRSNTPVKLRLSDPDAVNACLLILNNIKGINMGGKRRMENLKAKAKIIREFILKEYQLR
ncbi:MAG: hypothetical protein EPN92_10300 [Chitinophagaceae bacterium]|nr:MAG: hypothetical protein EPN92_10300 [Chitinophagaceae bacterium]